MDILQFLIIFILGSILGSFYSLLIYRLPRGMSVISPPSHCTACGKPIRWYDNIPIISYIWLRGKCRYCGSKISIRYPLVEAFSGFLFVVCFLKFKEPFMAVLFFVFFSILLVASLIDWDTFTLPDSLTLGGFLLGLLSSLFRQDLGPKESLLSALVGSGVFLLIYLYYTKIRGIEGLGFGDIKLMAFIGSAFGMWGVLYAVFLGSLFGLLYAFPLIIKNRTMQFALPYGPFLSLGAFVGISLNLKEFIL
ncbi:MAG: prepilin peptidase [Aquificaceae bacterium]